MKAEKKEKHTVKECERALRGIKTEEYIMNGIKRVNAFKGADALVYLIETQKKTAEQARDILQALLEAHYIVRVTSDRERKTCSISIEYSFGIKNDYIWVKEGSQLFNILIGALIILFTTFLLMFQLWPKTLKNYTGYLFYLCLFLLGLLIAISAVRLIVYGVTFFTHPPGLWIFPNFFEDCGIIESFIPLYAFDTPPEEEKKEQ